MQMAGENMKAIKMIGVLLSSFSVQAFTPSCRKMLLFPILRSMADTAGEETDVPLLLSEGIFAVHKPKDWTSNDVVSYIRGILERDARGRGANPAKVGSRRLHRRVIKVGHGGTLDPLATGVLAIGVGKGTKELEKYVQ